VKVPPTSTPTLIIAVSLIRHNRNTRLGDP